MFKVMVLEAPVLARATEPPKVLALPKAIEPLVAVKAAGPVAAIAVFAAWVMPPDLAMAVRFPVTLTLPNCKAP